MGLVVALMPSYIHPDEHFQSLEMLTRIFYGTEGYVPWEFDSTNAARSYVPLLMYYGPLYYVVKNIFLIENPTVILYLARAQNYLLFLLTARHNIPYLLPLNPTHQKKALALIATSYVTWSFQSHTFSNSIETVILLCVLVTFSVQLSECRISNIKIPLIQGSLIVLGIFNRMTFPVFILLPSLWVFWKFYRKHILPFCVFIVSILFFTTSFIMIDTAIFHTDNYVVAPLNNLLYNLSVSNLADHGLHKRYTHILINLPQLAGPAMIYLFPTSPQRVSAYVKFLPWLTVLSTLAVLSIFPHQELRFLVPSLPYICILMSQHESKFILKLWIIFNIIMGLIIGVLHQSGIVTTFNNEEFYKQSSIGVHIWWKTYSPPTWMYMNKKITAVTTNFVDDLEHVDNVNFSEIDNQVIDLKGADMELANYTIHKFLKNENLEVVSLFYPQSMQTKVLQLLDNDKLSHKIIFHTLQHLDLDHFDTDDLTTFIPGFYHIEIYNN